VDQHLLFPSPLVFFCHFPFRLVAIVRRFVFRSPGIRRPLGLPRDETVRRAVQPQFAGFERFFGRQTGQIELQQDGIARRLAVVVVVDF
jgi:hypothetical protein